MAFLKAKKSIFLVGFCLFAGAALVRGQQQTPELMVAAAVDNYQFYWEQVILVPGVTNPASPETDSRHWFADPSSAASHDGSDSLRSPMMKNNEHSKLQTVVRGPTTVSFWFRIETQVGGDVFWVDAEQLDNPVPRRIYEGERYSGVHGWRYSSIDLPEAVEYLVSWNYQKDGAVSSGKDCVWLDTISSSAPIDIPIVEKPLKNDDNTVSGYRLEWETLPTRSYILEYQLNGRFLPAADAMVAGGRVLYHDEFKDRFDERKGSYRVRLIRPATFTDVPSELVDAVIGEKLELSASADGSEPIEFEWSRKPSRVGEVDTILGRNGELSLDGIDAEMEGKYVVKVSNSGGYEVKTFLIATHEPARIEGLIHDGATLSKSLVDGVNYLLINPRDTAVVGFNVVGELPIETTWERLTEGGWQRFNEESPVLEFASAKPEDSGSYRLRVSNKWSKTRILSPVLRIEIPDDAAIRSVPPGSEVEVLESEDVTLAIAVSGTPPFEFNWFRDGQRFSRERACRIGSDELGTYDYRVSAKSATSRLDLSEGITVKVLPADPIMLGFCDIRFIPFSAGKFEMGSTRRGNERPVRSVKLTNVFWVAETEVTQKQWHSMLGGELMSAHADYPMIVTWEDAMRFCRIVSEKAWKEKLLTDEFEVTLPTEAQWENACRTGLGFRAIDQFACFKENSSALNPVRSRKQDDKGLFDLLGNAWEWTRSRYSDDYSASEFVNPVGPAAGDHYVLRGGSIHSGRNSCTATRRHHDSPRAARSTYGFRPIVQRRIPLNGFDLSTID